MTAIKLPLGPTMIDVAGLTLTDEERQRLCHPLVGGVILFTRNYANPEQLVALTDDIRALRDPALIIAVDHEGGRVQRFRDGFTRLPAMRTLGEHYAQDAQQGLSLAEDVGLVLATELQAHGVDLSFTPVLDLDYGGSRVIGDRSFGRDPGVVAALAAALQRGLRCGGLAAVGKHFPGHGFAEADSHVEIPVDERSFDEIWADDIAPYRDLVLEGVMPAHVNYPQVDASPAGFSRVWLQDILRQRLGFGGVIFSDDLTMEGATVVGGIVQRAEAAWQAGCDMVLVCNRPDLADELLANWTPSVPLEVSGRIAGLRLAADGSPCRIGSAYLHARQRVKALTI